MTMTPFICLKLALLAITLGLALYYDISERKIKNIVTIPSALMGLAINTLEKGVGGLFFSVEGWLVPVSVLMIFYYINVMVAGDIKLIGSIGSIMGLSFAGYSFAYSIYIGGLIAMIILLRNKEIYSRMKRLTNYFIYIIFTGQITVYSHKEDRSSKFIFSAAIVPGTVIQIVATILQLKGVIKNAGAVIWF